MSWWRPPDRCVRCRGNIDRVIEVLLAQEENGGELCTKCWRTLQAMRGHERIVVDLPPVNVKTLKYVAGNGECDDCTCQRGLRWGTTNAKSMAILTCR